jgi:hypothetical protein
VTRLGEPGGSWATSKWSSGSSGKTYKPAASGKIDFREPSEKEIHEGNWGFEPEEVTNYGLGYPIKVKKKHSYRHEDDAARAELLAGMTVEEKAEELYAELAEIPSDMWSSVLSEEEFALVAPRIRAIATEAQRANQKDQPRRHGKKNRRRRR